MEGEEQLKQRLAGRRVGGTVVCLDTVDSTNSAVRRLAEGAPEGLAVLAVAQSAGRGRRGRSFLSLPEKGLYLSVLLRPRCTPAELSTLTAWTAVAVCQGIARCCGIRPGIKWPNDVVLNGKKLCGILTELEPAGQGYSGDVIVGIGINVAQTAEEFGPELQKTAISLVQAGVSPPPLAELAGEILCALDEMYTVFPTGKACYLAQYRENCLNLGRGVEIIRPDGVRSGVAEGVDEAFALLVRWPDGSRERIFTGEVSVRGLMGYV